MTTNTHEDVERAIRELRIETSSDIDRKILQSAGRELEAGTEQSRASSSWQSDWWARAARSRPFRLATAAVAVLVLITGLELLNGPGSGRVAWAEVTDRIAEVDRFSFRLGIRVLGEGSERQAEGTQDAEEHDVAMMFFFSSSLGFRWDVHSDGSLATSFIYPSASDSGIVISNVEKTWGFLPAPAEAPRSGPDSPVDDPEEYIRRFLDRDRTELGRRTIDGIEVEGVEVTNPPTQDGPDLDGIGRLWVSVESGLPVRIELEQLAKQQRVEWTLDFRWGAQVDAGAFEARVPDGYSQVR